MHVKINRDGCRISQRSCESQCMARFLRNPETSRRRCVQTVEDDGRASLTLEICASGRCATFILDEEGRYVVAQLGWSRYISLNETA